MTTRVAREGRDEAARIRLRSRPLIPGGEGAGAEHAWDVRYVERLGEALDEVRADASPRIWTTDGAKETPKLWAHMDGVAVRVDSYHSAFEGPGWVDGWARCNSAYSMVDAVVSFAPECAVRRAAIRAARVAAHFGDPDSTRFLDVVDAWNEASEPSTLLDEMRAEFAALSRRVDESARGGDDLPKRERRTDSLRAALFTRQMYASMHVYLNARRALSIIDETEDDGGFTVVKTDEDTSSRYDAMFAGIVRDTITLDMVVERLIARKREALDKRMKERRVL